MRVFVTGASGYVGRAVAAKLRTAGCDLLALARTQESADALARCGYRVVSGDMRDVEQMNASASACDATVHVAFPFGKTDVGAIFEPGPAAARLVYSALQGEAAFVRGLLEAYRGSGKTLLFFTGTGTLGDTGAGAPDESSDVRASTLFSLRRRTELDAIHAGAHGLRAVIIRAASVYGHGGSMLVPFLIDAASRLGAGFCIEGCEDNRWSFVHVDDLAALCEQALRLARPGDLLHGAAAAVRCIDVAEAIHDAMGCAGTPMSIPLSEAIARFGGLARFWGLNNQVTPKRSGELGWRPEAPSVLDDIRHGSYKPQPSRVPCAS